MQSSAEHLLTHSSVNKMQMEIVVQILQLLWIAGISLASILFAIEFFSSFDDKRSADKVSSRMKAMVFAIVFAVIAKIAKVVS